MPGRVRRGKAGGPSGFSGRGLINSILGETQKNGADAEGALGNSEVNPDFLEEEEFNTLGQQFMGEDAYPPAERSQPFLDNRRKLFGFGPRLGHNTAADLNTKYGANTVFGGQKNNQQTALQKLLNNMSLDYEQSMLPIDKQRGEDSALATYYGGRGTRTSPTLEAGGAGVIGQQQSEEIQRSKQAQQISERLFPSQLRAKQATAMEEANRAGVRLNASYTQPGRNAITQGYIGEQLTPAARVLQMGRDHLGVGDVSYQDFADELGVSPFRRGAAMRETPVMTRIPDGRGGFIQTPSGASQRSTEFPAGPGVGRITQADIDAAKLPTPAVAPTTSPPNAAMQNMVAPQQNQEMLSPSLMQRTGNFGFNAQNPANPGVWLQKLYQLLQQSGGGIGEVIMGEQPYSSPANKEHTDVLDAIKKRKTSR